MPGRAPAQGGQPRQPFGPQLKAALVQAAPLFSAMAAGYSSGRGPYAYLDQGIAGMQAMQKQKRDEEAAAAAAAAFAGLVPGGMGPAGMSTKGGAPGKGAPGGYYGASADPGFVLGVDALPQNPTTPGGYSMGVEVPSYIPEEVKNGIFAGESGGDYNALFGFSNRDGGQFSNVKLSDMTVDQALAFSDPSGPYGQWVKGQIGRVATPMGAYQIVGTTLRAAKDGLGLTGSERMTPELQDQLGGWIYANQGTGAWEGYRGPQAAPEGGWGGGSVTMSAKGEGSAPSVTDPLADPYVQRLMQVMAMPGLSPERRSVVELQLQTRMGQLTAPDPNAEEDRARERRARDAELLGYGRGTPEWNQYVVTGDVPKGPTPTDDMREYEMARSQGYTGTFQQYQVDLKKAGATTNTVTVGGGPSDDKLRGKLMEKEGELWSTYLQTGATSAGTVQDMAALDELIKVAPQGPVTGRLAEMFPGFSSAGDAFQSIVKRVAPTLRAPGSGATSDIEYDGMLRSLPALRNSPEANAAIAAMMKAKASLNVERARVIEEYQNGVIEAPEARKRMAELDKRSIMSPEVAAILGVDAPAEAAPSQAGGVPEGIDPADWQAMTPEERALWSN